MKKYNSLFFIVLFFLIGVFSCSKNSSQPSNVIYPAPGDISLNLTVNPSTIGLAIPSTFTGLSYETSSLTKSNYFNTANTVFINLIKNLGNGILRIGGNSSDKTIWSNALRLNSGATDSLFKDDVDRYFQFANAVGWKTMFGINVGTGSLTQASSEASYVTQSASNNLLYFELGNEPDIYHSNGLRPSTYSVSDYETDFNHFYQSIITATPSSQFSGPTSAYNTNGFTIPFANNEHANIKLLTQHYYAMGPAGDTSVTITRLLMNDATLTNCKSSA